MENNVDRPSAEMIESAGRDLAQGLAVEHSPLAVLAAARVAIKDLHDRSLLRSYCVSNRDNSECVGVMLHTEIQCPHFIRLMEVNDQTPHDPTTGHLLTLEYIEAALDVAYRELTKAPR